jgi:cystathionine beta-lyase
MNREFDHLPDRRNSDSNKWNEYAPDVLPMWVADMDFRAPPPVLEALHRRIEHGIFGYGYRDSEAAEVICARLREQYAWDVEPQELLYTPGLGSALNLVCRAIGEPDDQVLVQTPIYPPFLHAPKNQDRELVTQQLHLSRDGNRLRYDMDLNALERSMGKRTKLLMLCNPHNPVGLMSEPQELQRLFEICARHDLVICSDEIHCDLVLDHRQHHPMAALAPEISHRCITLMAPSKTYNLAGLYFGFAIVQDPSLKRRLEKAGRGILPHTNVMGPQATIAAYRHGEPWLQSLLDYLRANLDFALEFCDRYLPEIGVTVPSATYLLWMDCRGLGLEPDPFTFFLQEARVAFNDGRTFGPGGEGFVRLNFGCPRATLEEGLERMRAALAKR